MARNKTWAERIVAARKACKFNRDDKKRASKWSTCAVGETFDLKNGEFFDIKDAKLYYNERNQVRKAGYEFDYAVMEDKPAIAAKLLATIQKLKAINDKRVAAKQKLEKQVGIIL